MDKETNDSNATYPSNFQRRMFWGAATAISIVIIAAIGVGAIFLGGKVLGYLQPILVPIAIAGIIAYLLEPIIYLIRRKTRWKHRVCMLVVFISFLVLIALLVIAVVVPSFGQAREVIDDWDKYKAQILDVVRHGVADLQTKFNNPIARKYYESGIEWISVEGPRVGQKVGAWTWDKLMGAFGFFGYLLGLILVPIYLFFFLKESHTIKNTWSDYLPLRASRFKDEVVDTLKEVNQYLVSFFRGQMVVSLIDGALVAVALSLVLQLPYALLIGVFLAILGLIPYIGNVMVMIPAVLIAIAHFGHQTPIDYPMSSDVVAKQVKVVPMPGGNRKKYISDVTELTLVTVVDGDGEIVNGTVPYVAAGQPPAAGDKPEVEGELVETDESEQKPFPAAVGKVMNVRLENGVVERREIHSIIKSVKRAEVMTNAWSFLPNMWFYPLIVVAIFVILQQVNGLITAPKIVGDSVGLHPLTVIFSVLFWSFLLGGLLGALLAVPLTASIKVLFRRYIWVKRIEPKVGPFGDQESGSEDGEPDPEPA